MSTNLELKIERIFDTQIQNVWNAWTEPELLREWSCPESFVITEISGELKVGGNWTLTMVSEKLGYTGKLRGEYKVIDQPHRLVSTHVWVDENGNDEHETEYTVELSEIDGKTHMVFTQTGFVSVESRDSHESGWGETFNKLGQLLN